MDLLPLAPPGATGDEEDEGEFVPCQFSDDEESDDELEHGQGCRCPLCIHGDGGTGASHQVLAQMEDIDRTMTGKVSDKAIWQLQANISETRHRTSRAKGLKHPPSHPKIAGNISHGTESIRNASSEKISSLSALCKNNSDAHKF